MFQGSVLHLYFCRTAFTTEPRRRKRPKSFLSPSVLSLGEGEDRFISSLSVLKNRSRQVFLSARRRSPVPSLRLRPASHSSLARPLTPPSPVLWGRGKIRERETPQEDNQCKKTQQVEEDKKNPAGFFTVREQKAKEFLTSSSSGGGGGRRQELSHSFCPVACFIFLLFLSVFFSNQGLGCKESNKPAALRL